MSGLIELAARVEAAEGPDRELDALIYRALAGFPTEHWFRYGETHLTDERVPFVTASLDAAMTLVPEGVGDGITAEWNVERWASNGVYPEHVRATAWVCGARRAYAATPALALVAAALRARASGEGEGGSAG
jgi:hypothetical protein